MGERDWSLEGGRNCRDGVEEKSRCKKLCMNRNRSSGIGGKGWYLAAYPGPEGGGNNCCQGWIEGKASDLDPDKHDQGGKGGGRKMVPGVTTGCLEMGGRRKIEKMLL